MACASTSGSMPSQLCDSRAQNWKGRPEQPPLNDDAMDAVLAALGDGDDDDAGGCNIIIDV